MQKTSVFVILDQKPKFAQFLAKMAKTVKVIKKALGTFFSHLQALTNCKVSEKSNEGIPRKCEKPPFWAFWAKMTNFGQFLAKMGKTGFFSKKRLEHFFAFTSPN